MELDFAQVLAFEKFFLFRRAFVSVPRWESHCAVVVDGIDGIRQCFSKALELHGEGVPVPEENMVCVDLTNGIF